MNNRYMNSCGCDHPDMPPMPPKPPKDKKSLAMAYVPWQKWQNVMDGCSALKHGTIFEELVLPFEGSRAACSHFSGRNANPYDNNHYRRGMR